MPWLLRGSGVAALATTFASAVAGGLLRAGVPVPAGAWAAPAVQHHAALMMAGFFGTVIALERAVALKRRPAFAVPLATLAAAGALLAGHDAAAQALFVLAGIGFVAVNLALWRRQPAFHVALLGVSALMGLIGHLVWAWAGQGPVPIASWSSFLVLTVAAERLEMTRLMRHRPGSRASLVLCVLGLCAGALSGHGLLFGGALAALALWLLRHDIARRTVRAAGLPRYMAVCLLSGHAWLLVAGLAWAGLALGWHSRDLALHALGLGFLVSMVMGHAPVILPAVARVKVLYRPVFYLPWGLLQASMLLRFCGARDAGAVANVVAIGAFVLTLAGAALAWRRRHGGRGSGPRARAILES